MKQAEALAAEVLDSSKRVLGEQHMTTLLAMGNLALTYRAEGRTEEAVALEEKQLELRKQMEERAVESTSENP
jgi:nitrogen-specific signal transduction histidine kinase